jgi:glycosyltransferase involved in cell wall biosynthesis
MRIGIDARPLARGVAGISRVVRSLLEALARVDAENLYFLYSNRDFRLPGENPLWQKRVDFAYSVLPGTLWLLARAAKMMREDRLDVWWATMPVLPRTVPPSLRKIITVNDLVPYRYPETMSFYNRRVSRWVMPPAVRRSDLVVAISDFTRKELQAFFGTEPPSVEVIHCGVTEHYSPRCRRAAAARIAGKFQTSTRYVCTVGTIEPRKNLMTLIEAMRILWGRGQLPGHQLLIAGAAGWKDSPVYARATGLGEAVKFLGYVPEEDLPFLYSGADVFAFPSLYEGFGLPLAEAMACGVPIVASGVSSIPEVVQDAALLVSPRSPEEFADAIARIVSDPALRHSLVQKGLERARHFQWEDAARKMLRLLIPAEDRERTGS